jgi:acetyl esterase/lipase
MKKFLLVFLFLGTQLLYVSCTKDNDNPTKDPLTAETFMDVSYGANPQEKYDLYLPADRSSEKTKVIVLIHGGGWTGGDKTDMDFIIPYLKLRHPNHAIVNMNYVLADATTPAFPNQFLDVDAVLDKLAAEKDELDIEPVFALVGVSAGAHISLMYDYVYDPNDRVKLVGDIVGPTDFTDPFYADNPNFDLLLAALVDEEAYPPGTDYAEVLSPALRVSDTSSPTLLFYGNADPLVPLSNATTLNTALNVAEIDHSFTTYDGGHADWSPTDFEDMKAQISSYIDEYLEVTE